VARWKLKQVRASTSRRIDALASADRHLDGTAMSEDSRAAPGRMRPGSASRSGSCSKGVPLFAHQNRFRHLLPFALPLVTVAVSFELAALPWLVLDEPAPDPDEELLLNVATVAGMLVVLFPTLPFFGTGRFVPTSRIGG
jgi:hypothetical protein